MNVIEAIAYGIECAASFLAWLATTVIGIAFIGTFAYWIISFVVV